MTAVSTAMTLSNYTAGFRFVLKEYSLNALSPTPLHVFSKHAVVVRSSWSARRTMCLELCPGITWLVLIWDLLSLHQQILPLKNTQIKTRNWPTAPYLRQQEEQDPQYRERLSDSLFCGPFLLKPASSGSCRQPGSSGRGACCGCAEARPGGC